MTRILLIGANGRMGQAISDAIKSFPELAIARGCARGENIADKMNDVDVAIDVSHPDATNELCAAAVKGKVALVIGTTGHSPEERAVIERAAQSVPVVLASNFSIGVNALFSLTRAAAKILGDEFSVSVVETHHTKKKDAPSGTAKTIAEILRKEGRAEVPIESIREGDVVGEHTVIFAGPREQIELKHRAGSREFFARGALHTADWIVGKLAKLYSMEDVLRAS
jgi:4-hydroxy-tetrahydrodipicolinate reductase